MATTNGRGEMSRAELFEDEKKRIIDSCFSKVDDDGSIFETYITHIRIVEFSSSPTAPPPPQSRTPQSEKPRVIIVSVRKSGRVRVHKSKENANGTFSIGKTWNLDDLTGIESFTAPSSNPTYREWAGQIGFVVTLGKQYYWEAAADKEKKFFIASLIKIYGKYTGGRTPSLTGFDQRELDQVLGGAQARRPPERTQPPPSRPAIVEPTANGSNNLSASSYAALSGGPPPSPSPQTTSFRKPVANGSPSPAPSANSSLRSADPAMLRRLASNNKSQDSVANSLGGRSDDTSSLRPRSRNGVNGGAAYATPPPEPMPTEERPPERKRPPMDPMRPQAGADDLVPAPLMSPSMRRDNVIPPPRSMERESPRKPSLRSKRSEISDSTAAGSDRTPTGSRETNKIDAPGGWPNSSTSTPGVPADVVPFSPPPPVSPPSDVVPETPIEPEDSRPGLGPMIKAKKSKGDLAGALWKAAAAATAFKPRPGGAAERLRNAQAKNPDGPDGITEVVPARPRSAQKILEPVAEKPKPAEKPKAVETPPAIPEVKVTLPNSSRPTSLQASVKDVKKKEDAKLKGQEDKPSKLVVVGNDVKYLATLGLDPAFLDSRSTDFAQWLDYFGWVPGDEMRSRNYDEMKIDVERELNRAQAGGWLARFQEEDERVDAIKKGIDVAMTECEELDNLLTLYSVELSTLADDIAFIEAQGQGLQVQAANQKLLRKELETLLETCNITFEDLAALRTAPLETFDGLGKIEDALVTLYKAMAKIDPTMGSSGARKSEDDSNERGLGVNSDYERMRIVQEKKELYLSESFQFMRRFVEFMARQFDDAYRETKRALDGALSKKVDAANHDAGRELLWRYSPLVLYSRDMDVDNWNRVMQLYQEKSHPLYRSEFKEALESWKRNARKPTGEEAELLFTFQQEKKEEGIATTARKLTVKRSQTLARTLRSPLGDASRTNLEKVGDNRAHPYEVFDSILDDLLPLVEIEQNFMVDFFHATSLEQFDFADVVAMARPQDRQGGDLKRHRVMEPDRDLARRVTRAMETVFSFLEQDLQGVVDWVLSLDPLQGIGVLANLERKMADIGQSNQDFMNSVLQKIHGNLEGRFKKFVDEQIRAIEETKVKIKKRKGVISFMRVFPHFMAAVEAMLVGTDSSYAARRSADREYDRILKTMFDSLKVIARENPAAGVASITTGNSNSADPEDKEALNFHILLIENMNHYLEEVDNAQGIEVLDDWREAATSELNEHMGLYLNAVMRRPLGRLLEHLENIEAQLNGGKSPAAVAAQPSNSKAIFNKVLGGYDAREVRKGIEALRKRVEKHFGDADEPALSKGLVTRVLRECEKFYADVELRIGTITTNVYGGDVLFEWPRADVRSAFASVGR